ncbi:MAG: hypothetical protein EAX96_08805 [Candidatus Lokiarchaeota archaeon]|nr:hypothetical protein [Candidatus Lokiarchaeota archaeon]
MDVLNKINEGLNQLKNKDIEAAIEAFSNAVALSGQNIQEEIKWAYSERNFEVTIEIANSLFAFSWMLYTIKLVSINKEDAIKNTGKIEGILDFYNNILSPVIKNMVDFLDKKQKSISRKLANNILVLKNGFENLDSLNKEI